MLFFFIFRCIWQINQSRPTGFKIYLFIAYVVLYFFARGILSRPAKRGGQS